MAVGKERWTPRIMSKVPWSLNSAALRSQASGSPQLRQALRTSSEARSCRACGPSVQHRNHEIGHAVQGGLNEGHHGKGDHLGV